MLKKINIFIFLWLSFFIVSIQSDSVKLRYEIYFDSSINNEVEIKEELLEIYQSICLSVDKDLRTQIVSKNIELFKLDENFEVTIEKNTMVITIGNGKGTYLSGDFEGVICGKTVKPKSWILELFN